MGQTLIWSQFFFQEVFKIVQAQFCFFAVLLLISVQVQFISFVTRKADSTNKQQNYKRHKKCDRLLSLKVAFNFQIFQRSKSFSYGSNFLNLG